MKKRSLKAGACRASPGRGQHSPPASCSGCARSPALQCRWNWWPSFPGKVGGGRRRSARPHDAQQSPQPRPVPYRTTPRSAPSLRRAGAGEGPPAAPAPRPPSHTPAPPAAAPALASRPPLGGAAILAPKRQLWGAERWNPSLNTTITRHLRLLKCFLPPYRVPGV